MLNNYLSLFLFGFGREPTCVRFTVGTGNGCAVCAAAYRSYYPRVVVIVDEIDTLLEQLGGWFGAYHLQPGGIVSVGLLGWTGFAFRAHEI